MTQCGLKRDALPPAVIVTAQVIARSNFTCESHWHEQCQYKRWKLSFLAVSSCFIALNYCEKEANLAGDHSCDICLLTFHIALIFDSLHVLRWCAC
jgi:hypothetical protein